MRHQRRDAWNCYSLASPTTWIGLKKSGGLLRQPPVPSTTTNAQGSPNPDNTYANGGYPAGLLWPFIEGNPKTFKCSKGKDPVTGQDYQCSYAMNYVNWRPNGRTPVS
ncbi:MAG: hypothetical protein U0797_09040 [Gemmataceae bacterium]